MTGYVYAAPMPERWWRRPLEVTLYGCPPSDCGPLDYWLPLGPHALPAGKPTPNPAPDLLAKCRERLAVLEAEAETLRAMIAAGGGE